MRRRNVAFRVGLALLVALSISCAGCFRHCCLRRARHGVVFRGSFALELNRVPWVHSRTELSDERSELAAQLEAQGCQACIEPPGAIGPPADAEGCQAAAGEAPCEACVRPIRGTLAKLRILGGRLRPDQGLAVAAQPEGISRFHPLPTQPVFARRDWLLGSAPIGRPSGSQGDFPGSAGEQVAPVPALPAAPAMEGLNSLPPEPALQPAPGRGQQVRASSGPSAVRSWVFIAPEPSQVDGVAELPPRRAPRVVSR